MNRTASVGATNNFISTCLIPICPSLRPSNAQCAFHPQHRIYRHSKASSPRPYSLALSHRPFPPLVCLLPKYITLPISLACIVLLRLCVYDIRFKFKKSATPLPLDGGKVSSGDGNTTRASRFRSRTSHRHSRYIMRGRDASGMSSCRSNGCVGCCDGEVACYNRKQSRLCIWT